MCFVLAAAEHKRCPQKVQILWYKSPFLAFVAKMWTSWDYVGLAQRRIGAGGKGESLGVKEEGLHLGRGWVCWDRPTYSLPCGESGLEAPKFSVSVNKATKHRSSTRSCEMAIWESTHELPNILAIKGLHFLYSRQTEGNPWLGCSLNKSDWRRKPTRLISAEKIKLWPLFILFNFFFFN